MTELKIWFLDVGHGDCAYAELPNGARMMVDCGDDGDHWPSLLLKHYRVTGEQNPVPIPNKPDVRYGLDNLIISHPHGDHISDIQAIHEEIGFYWLTGGYRSFIDDLDIATIDFRKRGKEPAEKFKEVVKKYYADYVASEDRVALAVPSCIVKKRRFIDFQKEMDLNELSWFVSLEFAGQKVLFTGDMTRAGINRIMESTSAAAFREFVKGTSILKIPHHARENGCSQELFDCIGSKPLLGVASDETLNENNENTSSIDWYYNKMSDTKVLIDGIQQDRRTLTTRKDKDIFLSISDKGVVSVQTNCFAEIKPQILGGVLSGKK